MIAARNNSTNNASAKQKQHLGERKIFKQRTKTKNSGLQSTSYTVNRLLPSNVDNFKATNDEMQPCLHHGTKANKDIIRAEIYAENAIKKDLFHEEFKCFLNRARSKSLLEHNREK